MKLIDDWRGALKFYSLWALSILAVLPDIFGALRDAGLFVSGQMPPAVSWAIRAIAIFGIVSRFVSQQKPKDIGVPRCGDHACTACDRIILSPPAPLPPPAD